MPRSIVPESLGIVERYVLAVLGARNREAVPGKLHLQKHLFLLSKMNPKLAEKSGFVPYLKGPWSEEVENALEDLRALALIELNEGERIRLSDLGSDIYEEMKDDIPDEISEQVEEVKDLLNDMTEEELLVFLYVTHPDMTQESVMVERAMRHRREAAERLYREGKVSLEKAAEVAGMRLSDFLKEVSSESA